MALCFSSYGADQVFLCCCSCLSLFCICLLVVYTPHAPAVAAALLQHGWIAAALDAYKKGLDVCRMSAAYSLLTQQQQQQQQQLLQLAAASPLSAKGSLGSTDELSLAAAQALCCNLSLNVASCCLRLKQFREANTHCDVALACAMHSSSTTSSSSSSTTSSSSSSSTTSSSSSTTSSSNNNNGEGHGAVVPQEQEQQQQQKQQQQQQQQQGFESLRMQQTAWLRKALALQACKETEKALEAARAAAKLSPKDKQSRVRCC